MNYYLDAMVGCQYSAGMGSCPDYVFSNSKNKTTSAELISCDRSGDALAIRMKRPLGASDGLKNAWPVDGTQYAMYAIGPVSSSSNTQQPDILLHYIKNGGGSQLKVPLSQQVNDCSPIINLGTTPASTQPAAAAGSPSSPFNPSPISTAASNIDSHAEAGESGESGHDHEGGASSSLPSLQSPSGAQGNSQGPGAASLAPIHCEMVINGEKKYFETCFTAASIAPDFNVAWNLSADPANAANTILTMGMNATLNNQYVSVGFPSNPGRMVNAAAMILSTCPSCQSGGKMEQYYMTSTSSSGVNPSSQGLNVKSVDASSANGVTAGIFVASIPAAMSPASATGRRLSQSSQLSAYNLLFAAGDMAGTVPQIHYAYGSNDVDLSMAVNGGGYAGAPVIQTLNMDARTAHMWLGAISWGLFIPIGVVSARSKTQYPKKWFMVHRLVQTLGYLLGIATIATGFAVRGSWETPYETHRDLGVAITALGTVQIISLVAKPGPGHKWRKYWTPWHRIVGWSTVLMAIANIYYGMFEVARVATWAWATYTAVLGVIVVVGIFIEIREYRVRKQQEQAKMDFDLEMNARKSACSLADSKKELSERDSEDSE